MESVLGDEDLNAFKFNEEKLMTWLQKKSERVAEALQSKNVHVMGGSISATFVKSSVDAPAPKGNFFLFNLPLARTETRKLYTICNMWF